MRHEWDGAKARHNLAKHGLSFEDAPLMLDGRPSASRITASTMASSGLSHWACSPVALSSSLIPRAGTTRRASSRWERRTAVSKRSIKSDLERVDRLTDETLDYADIPPLDEAFLGCAEAQEAASRMSHLGVSSASSIARSDTFAGTSPRRRSSSRVARVPRRDRTACDGRQSGWRSGPCAEAPPGQNNRSNRSAQASYGT